MYANAKITTVEIIPRIRGVGDKQNDKGSKFMLYLVHFKNF
jgi:hypothetical protein